jgi:NAD(P)-dependent dehydrogenase (short-subunit alcohol dehydrogenase family)
VVAAGDVAVAAVRRPESVRDLVEAYPGSVEALSLDVTELTEIDRSVADIVARHGRIDVVVNNAGRSHVGAVEETTDAELRALFEVHFFGPAALTRAVLPYMRMQRSGAIVQMSSMGGRLSFAGISAYSATKFALEGFSEALHAEVAPHGITVLIVEPGNFRTGLLTASSESDPLPAYADTVGATKAVIRQNDGKQIGDPARAAAAIITALNSAQPPLRLVLGPDALDAIRSHTKNTEAELNAWECLARNTIFPTTSTIR